MLFAESTSQRNVKKREMGQRRLERVAKVLESRSWEKRQKE